MQRGKLKEFYDDKAMQNAWAEFIIEVLNAEALKKVYEGEDTSAVREARNIIEKSFGQLADNFKKVEERSEESKAL